MVKLTVHENNKECDCVFCLIGRMKCPECGSGIRDFEFSLSYVVAVSDDSIFMQGDISDISEDSMDFDRMTPNYSLDCPECGEALPKKNINKLAKALWKIAGGNIEAKRDEDGKIDIERFFVKSVPELKEIK